MDPLPSICVDPETFLRRDCYLPPLPEVVSRIQQIIHDENITLNDVVEIISSDPALVAQILKIVNSAYYSLPREIIRLQYAIAYLGLNEIYRMVLTLSVVDTLAVQNKRELHEFWFHSFYVALCGRFLARKFEPQLSVDELWPAAILHDIGKLVYLKFFHDHYRGLLQFCLERGCMFSRAEKALSVPPSAYFGELLCDHWKLPRKIKEACRFHALDDIPQLPREGETGAFRRIVCLANLCALLGSELLGMEANREIADALQQNMDYTEQEFLALMGSIYELKIDAESFMKNFAAA